MPFDPRMQMLPQQGMQQGMQPPQQPQQAAQGVMAPAQRAPVPPKGQDDRRDNPQVDERERALIANKLGTARDFADDATSYFRAVDDFKGFAKQLGVDRMKLPDVNMYLSALGEAADYYIKSGRWQEMLEAHHAGTDAPPY